MKLVRAMATVGGLTGLSRVAGFLRDILSANILGAGPVADAFFVALKLPNFFRRVTAEGAFTIAFVPLYSETLEKDGEEEAARFAGNAFAVMLWALLAFTLLAMMAMPWVINVIAPGFGDDGIRYPLAVELSRITFPYLLMMSLTSLLGGMLNAHNRFAPFAGAPILFNLCMVGGLLLSGHFTTAGHGMAYGIFVAGILQLLLLLFFVRRYGIGFKLQRPRMTPRMKKLLVLMGPAVFGAGVMHVNLFADMIIASFLGTGAISYLYYADRLNQLPLGMVGIAVGTALLPMLSRAFTVGDARDANDLFNRALEICLFLALPAATGLFVISYPIIATLFEHGAFSHEAADITAKVLTAYAVGMPAYIFVKVYSTAYWASQDTITPVKASIAATLFNILLSLWLVFFTGFGVVGIALATGVTGWLQIALLARGLRKNEATRFDARFKRSAVKITAGCVLMAGYLYAAMPFTHVFFLEEARVMQQITGLGILIGGGGAIYAGVILATGALTISDIRKTLKKGV